jgi:hypothetical protein
MEIDTIVPMRINPAAIQNWRTATKTRPIKAKPLRNLLVDSSVTSKFLVETLEGREPLGDNVVICVGEAGDTWQQTPKALLKKYNVTNIDADGWLHCDPKPDNVVDCVEVSDAMCEPDGHNTNVFSIVGLWGETIGDEKNIQRGVAGDVICRNQTDKSDVWIVRRKLFNNTYQFTS